MSVLVENAKMTVDGLLARRQRLNSYATEDRIQYALDLVEMHFHEENPERIDECIRLYAESAQWEAPARRVTYTGPQTIKKMYLNVFSAIADVTFTPLERWATPNRVFDDLRVTFRLIGPGFENCPLAIGTRVDMRLIHVFHIHDGLIAREIGYELWRAAG